MGKRRAPKSIDTFSLTISRTHQSMLRDKKHTQNKQTISKNSDVLYMSLNSKTLLLLIFLGNIYNKYILYIYIYNIQYATTFVCVHHQPLDL